MTKLFVAQNGTSKIPLKKFTWVPLARPFPGHEAHKLFLQKCGGFGCGGESAFLSLISRKPEPWEPFFSGTGITPVC